MPTRRSGQLMLEALVKGVDGKQLSALDIAQLAQRNARKKIGELTAALEGHQMRDFHRSLIRHAMQHMPFLAEEIEALDRDIAALIQKANLTPSYELLQTIPGIQSQAAATILAESGPDMKQFPAPANFSPGRDWRPAITRVRESASAPPPCGEIRTSRPPWPKRPGQLRAPSNRNLKTAIKGSRHESDIRERSLPVLTGSPSVSTRSWIRVSATSPERNPHSTLGQETRPAPHPQTEPPSSLAGEEK